MTKYPPRVICDIDIDSLLLFFIAKVIGGEDSTEEVNDVIIR